MFSADDAARYRRYEEQVKGFQPIHGTLSKYGLGSADGVKTWEPFFQKASQLGYTPKELLTVFGDGAGDGQASHVDPKAIRDEILAEVRRERAEADYTAASKAEERLLAEAVSKVAAGGDPDLVGAWFREKAAAARQAYAEDHPLKGKQAPLDENGIQGIVKLWQEKTAKNKGASMHAAATRANKPVPGVVGAAAPAGKAADSSKAQTIEEFMQEKLDRRVALRNSNGQRAAV